MKYRTMEIIKAVGKLLPESRFKEFLRSHFYRGYANQRIYRLNRIISQVQLLGVDTLLVELNNGLKFYVPQTKVVAPELRYADPGKLGKIKGFEHFPCWGGLYRYHVEGACEEPYELKRGDTVIEAGAYIGMFTVKSSKAVGNEGKVIAIEPEPDNLSFLRRNIDVNGLTNVIVVPKGAWNKKGKLKLYLSEYVGRHSFYAEWANSNIFTEVEVDTLDNILSELQIKGVNFINMNCEGGETEALKGMEGTLKNNDAIKLMISGHHYINGEYTYKTAARRLKKKGFEIHITKNGTVYGWRK